MTDAKPARGPRDDKSGQAAPKAKGTEYVVLRLAHGEPGVVETLEVVGRARGTTDTQAIDKAKDAADRAFPAGSSFVAVPSRSWRLRTEKVDTITRKSWV